VRGLIVFVLVIGAGLGWIVQHAGVQRDAVAAIETAGCEVFHDWESKDGHRITGGEPWPPKWLADLIGIDYFGHVTSVWLSSTSTPIDAVLAQVRRLTGLRTLTVMDSNLTDAGLVHLKGLTR
jgi:hypothetical protein